MDDAFGHAPQITLLRSWSMHVSAAVHENELTPGSTPAQHLVGSGRVVIRGGSFRNVMLQFKGLLLLHVRDFFTSILASLMPFFTEFRPPAAILLRIFTMPAA
jgi:hypothetical protein